MSDRVLSVIATQRNQALDTVAQVVAQRDETAEKLTASWEALNAVILSGQVPAEDVPRLVASIPDFGAWRDAMKKA